VLIKQHENIVIRNNTKYNIFKRYEICKNKLHNNQCTNREPNGIEYENISKRVGSEVVWSSAVGVVGRGVQNGTEAVEI